MLTYYHTDMLGSVRAVTNTAGGTVLRHDFEPFGEGGSMQGDPRQFMGLERDGESRLDYLKARYYRPVWGRFTSVDPIISTAITNPQRWNRYAYALNNPLKYVDPTGLDAEEAHDFDTEEGAVHCSEVCLEFNSWAEQGYLTNMVLDWMAGKVKTDALLNAFPTGTRDAIQKAIAITLAPIIFPGGLTLPGGMREMAISAFPIAGGVEFAFAQPGPFRWPTKGAYDYRYSFTSQPHWIGLPLFKAHVHPPAYPVPSMFAAGPSEPDKKAAKGAPFFSMMVGPNAGENKIWFYGGPLGSNIKDMNLQTFLKGVR